MISITKNDLKKALSVPWSTQTCLLATTVKRLGAKTVTEIANEIANMVNASDTAHEAMILFDNLRYNRRASLAKLRKMLPIKIKL